MHFFVQSNSQTQYTFPENTVNSLDILGASGLIAKRLENYEERQQQLEMAEAVANAIAGKHHLVVEAGTGVGKSFGYLVPAILSLQENQESRTGGKRRIIVSTHTISLQEQLIEKDVPLLNSVIPLEFSAVLAKGRAITSACDDCNKHSSAAKPCSTVKTNSTSYSVCGSGRPRRPTAHGRT